MKVLFATFVFVAVVTMTVVQASPDCSEYGNCETCASAASEDCGWCNGLCVRGNSTGPAVSDQCGATAWHWHGFHCPTSCSQYKSCESCGSDGCGWCGGQCHSGSSSGPSTQGRCGSSAWHWGGHLCPPAPPTPRPRSACAAQATCGDCTNVVVLECGWCAGECHEGNWAGPAHAGLCNGSTWHFNGVTCPAASGSSAGDACEAIHDCSACTMAGDCGWCDGRCLEGNLEGPFQSGECHDKHWHWSGASCPPQCHKYDGQHNCLSCVNSGSGDCGWCGASNKCVQGNTTGPVTPSQCVANNSWHYFGAHCPTAPPPPADCSLYTDCQTCAFEHQRCGWCASTNKCLLGNSTFGPAGGGHCPAHSWHPHGLDCPRPAADCDKWLDCFTCTTAPSGKCGFCSKHKTCVEGSSAGPHNGTCGGEWQWFTSMCPSQSP